jgi:hypothetical protein
MRKQTSSRAKLALAKETIRSMLAPELRGVAGGGVSCGPDSACDCSTTAGPASLCNCGTAACTASQY